MGMECPAPLPLLVFMIHIQHIHKRMRCYLFPLPQTTLRNSTCILKFCTFLTSSAVFKSHYRIVCGNNAPLLLGLLMQKFFQQNSGMLRQTELVIFSQTASLLLMNAAGRVSVSPAEITVNTGNMCPLWVAATLQDRRTQRQRDS